MNTLFNIVMPLMIALAVAGGVSIVRRTRQRREAWESGLTARARVVRTWQTVQMVNNVARRVQWHEYDFTADGRAVRFKESGGPPSREVGDETLVHYTADDPEKATASEPQPGKDMAVMVFTLLLVGASSVAILYFWLTTPQL